MSDTVTTTQHTSFFSKLWSSIQGIFFWFLLIIVGIVFLFWNESWYISMYNAIMEVSSTVTSTNSTALNSALNQKPIHIQWTVQTTEQLSDPIFGVVATTGSLSLNRNVETYLRTESSSSATTDNLWWWSETTTTYSYAKERSSQHIDSSAFQQKEWHSNPPESEFKSENITTTNALLWVFNIGRDIVEMIPWTQQNLAIASWAVTIPSSITSQITYSPSFVYIKANWSTVSGSTESTIGDVRISWSTIPSQVVSIIAKQTDTWLSAYRTSNNRSILYVVAWNQSVDDILQGAQSDNTLWTRIYRIIGVLLIIIWCNMMVSIIPTIAGVVPFLWWIVNAGVSMIAWLVWLVIGLLTIAIARFTVRPLLSGIIIVVCVALFFWYSYITKKSK